MPPSSGAHSGFFAVAKEAMAGLNDLSFCLLDAGHVNVYCLNTSKSKGSVCWNGQGNAIMEKSMSVTDLLGFLDYLANKGLANKATTAARKAAVNRVLGILDDEESLDVTKIDLDQVMARFSNLEGSNFTPQSLMTYKSRVSSAIEDFVAYSTNPLGFKPSGQRSPRKTTSRAESSQTTRNEISSKKMETQPMPAASTSIIPIPIRENLTILIQGLPFDLTMTEANKVANVVKAMASTD